MYFSRKKDNCKLTNEDTQKINNPIRNNKEDIYTWSLRVRKVDREKAKLENDGRLTDYNWRFLILNFKNNQPDPSEKYMISEVVPKGTIMRPGEIVLRLSDGHTMFVPSEEEYIEVHPIVNSGETVKFNEILGIVFKSKKIYYSLERGIRENEQLDDDLLARKIKQQNMQKKRNKLFMHLDDLSVSRRKRGIRLFSACRLS